MAYIYHGYEFKTDEFKKEYLDFLQHINEEMRFFIVKMHQRLYIFLTKGLIDGNTR